MRLRITAIAIVVAITLGGALVGRDLVAGGSGGGWSHEAGDAWTADRVLLQTYERGRPNLAFLVEARAGDVDSADVAAAAEAFEAELEARPEVVDVESYWSLGRPDWLRSRDGETALITARIPSRSAAYAGRAASLSPMLREVDEIIGVTLGGEVVVHRDVQRTVRQSITPLVVVSLLSLALVLLVLRNVMATALVAVTSALAVALTMLGLFGVSQVREVPSLSVLIGAAAAWAVASASGFVMLFRYLAERQAGAGRRDAVVGTISTAGRTVAIATTVFAGIGVALWLLPTALLRSTGYALGLAGLTAGLSSILVLGLLLAVVGVRVLSDDAPAVAPRASRPVDKVSRFVEQHRAIAALALVATLGPLLVFGSQVTTAEPGPETLSGDASSRRVDDAIEEGFDANELEALFVVSPNVLDYRGADADKADYAAELSRISGVSRVDSDQGTFVAGTATAAPPEVTARYASETGAWLLAPVGVESPDGEADRAAEAIRETAPPFRVFVGGSEARQEATIDAVAARVPAFVVLAVVIAVLLIAWLLHSVSAAIRSVAATLLITAGATAVVRWGFAQGLLAGPLGFTSTGSVAAVGPAIAWAIGFGIAGASVIFGWGAVREMFDLTEDTERSVSRALALTRTEHLQATALLLLPLLPLVSMPWRTGKLIGAAAIAAGLVAMTVGRFVAVPVAAGLGVRRLWPVTSTGEVRRVYPTTPSGRRNVARVEEAERMAAEVERAARESERQAAAEAARIAAELGLEGPSAAAEEAAHVGVTGEDKTAAEVEVVSAAADADVGVRPAAERPVPPPPTQVDRAAVAVSADEEMEPGTPDEIDVPDVDVAAPAPTPVAEAADAGELEEIEEEISDDVVAPAVGAGTLDRDDVDDDSLAEDVVVSLENEAVEPSVPATPSVSATPVAEDGEPVAGTVDVAKLTESVIAALDPTMPFQTELNSAFVANPANNLSRVMEAILRDASEHGGEEVLVYGHASRDRYRWMVVDSGPSVDNDPGRARTLAEAQRFIRRVGGVVECRPEGDFTVFVVEIPMAS